MVKLTKPRGVLGGGLGGSTFREFVASNKRETAISEIKGSYEFCQCGCRGWCTFFPLLMAVCANLAGAAMGVVNGEALGFHVAVTDITADWPAWLLLTGLRYWNHAKHPCPKCDATLLGMLSLDNYTNDSDPFNEFTHEQYIEFIASCTIVRCLVIWKLPQLSWTLVSGGYEEM